VDVHLPTEALQAVRCRGIRIVRARRSNRRSFTSAQTSLHRMDLTEEAGALRQRQLNRTAIAATRSGSSTAAASRHSGRPSALLAGRVTCRFVRRSHERRRRNGGFLRLLRLLVFAIASLLTLRHSSSPEKRRIRISHRDCPGLCLHHTTLFEFDRCGPIRAVASALAPRSMAGMLNGLLQIARTPLLTCYSNSLWAGPQYPLRGATSGLLPS
jgi:hypothetical protein